MTPWVYNNTAFNPAYSEILVKQYYGFVYLITCIDTGKRYCGKKSFYSFRKGRKHESDWRRYTGSSVHLTMDLVKLGMSHFTFEILSLHDSNQSLSYNEVRQLFLYNVLEARLSDGSPAFYNNSIPSSRFFRAA
jgi:Putative endonuclease segE, GIY-YIG domain